MTQISILNILCRPDNSGGVFIEPYSVKATNDVWDHNVIIFNDGSTRNGFSGSFTVPDVYNTDAAIKIIWTSTIASGDVEWDFDYRAVGGDDTESLDQSSAQETINQNDTAPSAAHERMVTTLNLTSANIAAEDTMEWELFRDLTDAGDTLAGAVIVFDILFEFTPT